MEKESLKRQLGPATAILVVMASMIGTGIFGNTGLIQSALGNPVVVVLMWALGGLVALAGALSYSEMAVLMPHAGGEYVYLRRIFGPLASFLTGWVSFAVGFAAPAASAALLSAKYAHEFLQILAPSTGFTHFLSLESGQKLYGILAILGISWFHMASLKRGEALQNLLSSVKFGLVLLFAAVGLYLSFSSGKSFPVEEIGEEVRWSGLGMGLLFVMFAYSGWNGASYLAEEIRDPARNLPRAMLGGTVLTAVLYVLLNILYYLAVPVGEISGESAVAALTAGYIFQKDVNATLFFNLAFTIMLLSSLSVSLMIGPRVSFAMARDGLFFRIAGRVGKKSSSPAFSILLQAVLSIVYVLSGTYQTIMIYMGFALAIFPVLAVAGMIYLRIRHPELERPYRTPLFPLVPLFFLTATLFTMVAALQEWTRTSLWAIAVVLAGVPVYFLWIRLRGSDPVR